MPQPPQPETESPVSASRSIPRTIEAFRWMLFARTFEEKIAALYRAGQIVGGVHLGRGQEAFSVALGMQLDRKRGDIYSVLIRDQAGRMAFGEPLLDASRTYLGSSEGPMRGRDGNIHRGRPSRGMPAMISHLGAMISVVNGMLIAKRFRGETGFVGAATIGEGGTSTGAWHEALNQASVERLPLIVAVANNQYAYSTPNEEQFACADLSERAAGYGIRGYSIDGTDLEACLQTFAEAIGRARAGEGPQLVVGKLLRLGGHGEHDDASYIPPQKRQEPCGGDCVQLIRDRLLAEGLTTETQLSEWGAEFQEKVEEAVARAMSEPAPDQFHESWQALSTKHLCEGMG